MKQINASTLYRYQATGEPKKRQKPINVVIISNSLNDNFRNTKERGNGLETILHSLDTGSRNTMKVSSSSNLNGRIHTDNLNIIPVCPCKLGIAIKLKKLGVSIVVHNRISPIGKSGEKLVIAPSVCLTKLTGIKLINTVPFKKMICGADICAGQVFSGVGGLSGTRNAPHDNNSFGHSCIIAGQSQILK